MASGSPSAPAADTVRAAFPYPTFPRLTAAPTREDIDQRQRWSIENASSRPSTRGGGLHGHAGMVVPPARYAIEFSPVAYIMEGNPGEAPMYPPGVTAAQQRLIDAQWRRAATIYGKQTAVHMALKTQLQNSIPPEYWAGLLVPGTGLATIDIQAMYQYLYANYGQITDADLELNRKRIVDQFDFASQTMETYFQRIYDAQQLTTNAGRPYTDAEIVGIAYLNIERSGMYPLDCREWEMRPQADKTYVNLRAHFIAAQVRQRRSRGLGNGMMNNIEALESAMKSFTEGTANDRAAAAELRQQNEALQASVNTLQEQMSTMFLGQQQQLNAAINAAFQQYQPPPQQQQGTGGRSRRRNKKQQQQAPWQPMQPPQPAAPNRFQQFPGQATAPPAQAAWMPMNMNPQFMQQFMQQQWQQNQQQPKQKKPLRSKTDYCHTHGYNVAEGHTSMTCRTPGPNHQYMATRENTMGGNMDGYDRINM